VVSRRRFPIIAIPYRLFALSNLASLLALLAYPVLIEPWIHDSHAVGCRGRVLYAVFPWRWCGYGPRLPAPRGGRGLLRTFPAGPAQAPASPAPNLGAPADPGSRLAGMGDVFCCSAVTKPRHRRTWASLPFLWILPADALPGDVLFFLLRPSALVSGRNVVSGACKR